MMLRTQWISALRQIKKAGFSTVVSVTGLSLAISICILIALFIRDEWTADTQIKDADRIYRVAENIISEDKNPVGTASTPPALAIALKKEIPEVEAATRIFPRGWDNTYYVRAGDKKLMEANICAADSNVFDIFSTRFISGNSATALNAPGSIVLTASMARKYFGNTDPMGKTVLIDQWSPRQVSAVIEDFPSNSHFKTDFFVSLYFSPMGNTNTWNWNSFYTYIKLTPTASIWKVGEEITAMAKRLRPQSRNTYFTQSLTSIHLQSHLAEEITPNSDPAYSYIFAAIAFFVLVIAGINFINLSTARAAARTKEIGIRRVSGASKNQLLTQFILESMLVSILAGVVALGIAEGILPFFNQSTSKSLRLLSADAIFIIPLTFAFSLFVGLLAGWYPAWYLASFHPVAALKGNVGKGRRAISVRNILTVLQFTVSIILLIGTGVMMQQLRFVRRANLGINTDQILVFNNLFNLDEDQRSALKTTLLKTPGVSAVASSDGVPGGETWSRMLVNYAGAESPVNSLTVDTGFLALEGIQLLSGRNIRFQQTDDTLHEILLNETAVKQMNIQAPVLGSRIIWGKLNSGQPIFASVVGVMKDFHFKSMRDEISPFVLMGSQKRQWKLLVKTNTTNMTATIGRLQMAWNQIVPDQPLQYTFLDETYAKLYASERNTESILVGVTTVAIVIACLGLFSLSLFTLHLRTKEIGIRKVLGASVASVVGLLLANMVKLMALACIIGFPLAYYLMNQWLHHFAYRIDMPYLIFAIGGLGALLLATLTTIYQTLRAATANPVKSLQSE